MKRTNNIRKMFMLVSMGAVLTVVQNVSAGSITVSEFYDLNDNQVPAGFNSVGGFSGGKFIGQLYSSAGRLSKSLDLNGGELQNLSVEWDGNMENAYWGNGTSFSLKDAIGVGFQVTHGTSTIFGGPPNPIYSPETREQIMMRDENGFKVQDYVFNQNPMNIGEFHYTAIYSDQQITYKATSATDHSIIFDHTVFVPDLSIADMEEIFFQVSTHNGAWMDNLSLTYTFSSVPDSTSTIFCLLIGMASLATLNQRMASSKIWISFGRSLWFS